MLEGELNMVLARSHYALRGPRFAAERHFSATCTVPPLSTLRTSSNTTIRHAC
jgi:hypothetical protein